MRLKNNKGVEKNFDILFEIEKDNKKYIVSKDLLTENIYSGKYENGKLKILNESEYEFINDMLKKING